MDTETLRAMALEVLRVAPVICGVLLGFRYLFYNVEEWNLDRVYCRLRWGKQWRLKVSRGDVLPVNPWFTRLGGLLLLGGVFAYVPLVYGEDMAALLRAIPWAADGGLAGFGSMRVQRGAGTDLVFIAWNRSGWSRTPWGRVSDSPSRLALFFTPTGGFCRSSECPGGAEPFVKAGKASAQWTKKAGWSGFPHSPSRNSSPARGSAALGAGRRWLRVPTGSAATARGRRSSCWPPRARATWRSLRPSASVRRPCRRGGGVPGGREWRGCRYDYRSGRRPVGGEVRDCRRRLLTFLEEGPPDGHERWDGRALERSPRGEARQGVERASHSRDQPAAPAQRERLHRPGVCDQEHWPRRPVPRPARQCEGPRRRRKPGFSAAGGGARAARDARWCLPWRLISRVPPPEHGRPRRRSGSSHWPGGRRPLPEKARGRVPTLPRYGCGPPPAPAAVRQPRQAERWLSRSRASLADEAPCGAFPLHGQPRLLGSTRLSCGSGSSPPGQPAPKARAAPESWSELSGPSWRSTAKTLSRSDGGRWACVGGVPRADARNG